MATKKPATCAGLLNILTPLLPKFWVLMSGAGVGFEVHAGTRFSTRFQLSHMKSVHTEL